MMEKNIDLRSADTIRYLSIAMVEKAQSGHPGGPMGGADFMHILYSLYCRRPQCELIKELMKDVTM